MINSLSKISKDISNIMGWRRYLLSALLGCVAAVALPPFYIIPLLFLSFPALLVLIQSSNNSKQAFAVGWWFGFGHFVTGLYWIANSLLVDAERFAWLIPFAVSLIPAVLAIYIGLVALIVFSMKLSGWRNVLWFAAVWVVVEMVRGQFLGGFPWNAIGYSWVFSGAMIQLTSITGVYGLSLLTVLIALIPYLFVAEEDKILRRQWTVGLITVLIVVFVGGALRISRDVHAVSGVNVRVVQANIPQDMKWEEDVRWDGFLRHIAMSRRPSKLKDIDYIILPETAVPFALEQEKKIQRWIGKFKWPKSYIFTGSLRTEGEKDNFKIWNSIHVLNGKGKILGHYDKFRLVPFGEFVPFHNYMPFIEKITHGALDFSSGDGVHTLILNAIKPFSPLICYEGIFPETAVNRSYRPEWILNVTNDAWFGKSTGPYQHFAMTRVRAVEQGLPLVRAANTGISAVVDGYGRVKASLGLSKSGVIDVALPAALPRTIYSRFYDSIPAVLIILLAGVAVFWPLQRQ